MATDPVPTNDSEDGVLSAIFDTLEAAGSVVSTADYWLGILTSFILLFIRHRIKLPKVRVSGGSSGVIELDNGEKFSSSRINIYNVPSFFGYPVKRETLSVAAARIYDPANRQYEGQSMHWLAEPDSEPFNKEIEAGEKAVLFVFGVHNGRIHHYVGTTVDNVERSETLLEIGSVRKLEIHIVDKLQRKYKIPFKISAKEQRNHVDGFNVQMRVKTTLADRLRNLRYGFNEIIRAFTAPSY